VTAFRPFSLNIRGKLFYATRPLITGIVNVTPDSFYSGSRTMDTDAIKRQVETHLNQQADMLDIGAYSSRPGSAIVSVKEETERLHKGLRTLREVAGYDIPVSVDTFRAEIARTAIKEFGADIINDISGGTLDENMFATVAELRVPYILMHMRGTPATMQSHTDYSGYGGNITAAVIGELSGKVAKLRQLGVGDIIVDPGFGFSKTLEQNYELITHMEYIAEALQAPILAGVSRKSMVYRALGTTPEESLNGTTALHTISLMHGASILRVHDVRAAREVLTIVQHTF